VPVRAPGGGCAAPRGLHGGPLSGLSPPPRGRLPVRARHVRALAPPVALPHPPVPPPRLLLRAHGRRAPRRAEGGLAALALALAQVHPAGLALGVAARVAGAGTEGRRWVDAVEDPDAADAEMEELMFAMREISFRKAAAAPALVLPLVTEEDGPDLGWVSELVM
jgi:hypothetical protein